MLTNTVKITVVGGPVLDISVLTYTANHRADRPNEVEVEIEGFLRNPGALATMKPRGGVVSFFTDDATLFAGMITHLDYTAQAPPLSPGQVNKLVRLLRLTMVGVFDVVDSQPKRKIKWKPKLSKEELIEKRALYDGAIADLQAILDGPLRVK